MPTCTKFEELSIWLNARELCKDIYRITKYEDFAKDMRFVSQIRAAAGSIMDNIAEGFERSGNREFIQFLYIANGSCAETRSQVHRAFDCHYISQNEYKNVVHKLINLSVSIHHFINYLKNSQYKGQKYKPESTTIHQSLKSSNP